MADWNLKAGDPLSLTLAADARLCTLDYCDDQIWELKLRSGEPPALALQTTYGLRARNMRLFPRFIEGQVTATDPNTFPNPPAIHRFFPNYLLLTYSPFPGIDVVQELWVPDNRAIAGRLRILNNGVTPRRLRFDWIAVLVPEGEGLRMSPTKIQGVTVLQGQSGALAPVVFLTGGPQAISSPFPGLSHELEFLPGQERRLTWAHVAIDDPERSFHHARTLVSHPWEAEIARVELTNARQVDIKTGEPAWDAAFALGQKVALGLVHGPTEHLPHPSFVLSRLPDQGFSLRGDGSDYDHLWNGQTALDAWYLTHLLLPTAPDLAKGFIENFLAVQKTSGYVDWKPGLGGQRSRIDATPLLASTAWEIYQATQDSDFIRAIFPDLLTFVLAWFGPYHDRDRDGVPEWDHPMQSGYEDHPTFDLWHSGAPGVDITTVESPSLMAFLFRECQSLIAMARTLGYDEAIPPLQAHQETLRQAVEASWDQQDSTYRYRDRDTHLCSQGGEIVRLKGSGVKNLRRKLDPPARLLVHILADHASAPRVRLEIRGRDGRGEQVVEKVAPANFRWGVGVGRYTSTQVFSRLSRLSVDRLDAGVQVVVRKVDLTDQDHTLLLPLWAGIPDSARAQMLVDEQITHPQRYGRRFGIPACPTHPTRENDAWQLAWLPWNTLVAEGLLAYGYRAEAATLVTRLMNAIVRTLQVEQSFRARYHTGHGGGIGERDALSGLPPLGLFLHTLGVQLLSPWKVALKGHNPFPWPVEVQYQGLSIYRERAKTVVIFPDGEQMRVETTEPCVVERS